MVHLETLLIRNLRSQNPIFGKLILSRNYSTAEGAVSHNVLYHQVLPITHHQFNANNYFQ